MNEQQREQERERERERKVDKLFELRDLFLVLIRSPASLRRNFCLPPYSYPHNSLIIIIRKRLQYIVYNMVSQLLIDL